MPSFSFEIHKNKISISGGVNHVNVSSLVDMLSELHFEPTQHLIFDLGDASIEDGVALVVCSNAMEVLSRRMLQIELIDPPHTLWSRLHENDSVGLGKRIVCRNEMPALNV